jgi:Flp pilus assembly protein TadG
MTRAGDRGSVTAEFAIALPAVVLVLAACLGGLQVAGHQLRLQDAAAVAARSIARGGSIGAAQARASRMVPGSSLDRRTDGDLECASLALAVPPGLTLRATSCALGGGQ